MRGWVLMVSTYSGPERVKKGSIYFFRANSKKNFPDDLQYVSSNKKV